MLSFITGLIGGFRTSMTILSVNLIFDLRDELSLKIKSLIGVFYLRTTEEKFSLGFIGDFDVKIDYSTGGSQNIFSLRLFEF